MFKFIQEESLGLWTLALFTLIFIFITPAFAQEKTSEPETDQNPILKQHKGIIKLAIPVPEKTFLFRYSVLKFTEAFSRLGYGFELHSFPSERALVESNSGRMDGEAGRIEFDSAMAAKYPNLIKVNEPTMHVTISAYVTDVSIHLKRWEDLKGNNLIVGYPRRLKVAERQLVGQVDTKRLNSVTNIKQGLRMLRHSRIDVLIALKSSIQGVLSIPEFIDSGIIQAGIMEEVPVFPYLHKIHNSLVPQLASSLKAMKEEGTLKRFAEAAKHPSDQPDCQNQ